jgi:transcriptional regulator with XRE-family HTH domain
MPTARPSRFATLLTFYRTQGGISRQHLAKRLHIASTELQRLEAGKRAPPCDKAFFERLGTALGVRKSDLSLLLRAQAADTPTTDYSNLLAEFAEQTGQGDLCLAPGEQSTANKQHTVPRKKGVQGPLTQSLHLGASMQVTQPAKGAAALRTWMKPEEGRGAQEPAGEQFPSKQPDQQPPGPKQGVVFDRTEAKLFFDALADPAHTHKEQAEAALQAFTKAVEQSRVTSLNKASKISGISVTTYTEWIAKGLIPSEYRDKNAIYLAVDIAQEVDRDNQEAKAMGLQTARLLRSRREKYFPPEPQRPQDAGTPQVAFEGGNFPQAPVEIETSQHASHYPHENVVFHVAQLQAEAQGKQRRKRDTVKSYEVVATLKQAAEKTGVPLEEIMTTRDIQAEFGINRSRIQRWTQMGPDGQPHLTPLSVRLEGAKHDQLLLRRSQVEELVSNPPPGGRPRR